ncbi:MAG: hypothetical protein AB1782_15915 [Cyanobacteriota bacterium]
MKFLAIILILLTIYIVFEYLKESPKDLITRISEIIWGGYTNL